jgi:hemoglobin
MKEVHQDLQITNAEFDASVGDLKATLDRLQIRNQEQKELLAIIESTRPQVVTVR